MDALTCSSGAESGPNDGPDTPSKLGTWWGHIGATNYQIAADNTGPTGLHRRSSRGGLHQAPQIPGGASYGADSTGGSL